MPPKKINSGSQHQKIALALILALTLWRVILLAFNQTDLFVDEAQYWLWGQSLEFGYFSKPPMIGWTIRAFTELGQSDSQFWVRLPGPLFHGATALLLMAFARHYWDRPIGAAVGLAYITVPFATVGSLVISTDSILLTFFALAFYSFYRLSQKSDIKFAVLLGLAIGLGMMTKYAMVYFVLGAALTMILFKPYRLTLRDMIVALVLAAILITPNLVWNSQNGFTTLSHTVDNANWSGLKFNSKSLGIFFASQFILFGPILFAAFLVAATATVIKPAQDIKQSISWLLLFSLPILLLLCFQATQSRAYANWAVTAYIAATPVAVNFLYRRARKWLTVSLVINGAFALLLPLAALFPQTVQIPGGTLMFERLLGRADLSNQIYNAARENQLTAIVSDGRDILADLFHTLHDQKIDIYAKPQNGPPPHHYVQRHALPDTMDRPFMFVTTHAGAAQCADSAQTAELISKQSFSAGYQRGNTLYMYKVPPGCWK